MKLRLLELILTLLAFTVCWAYNFQCFDQVNKLVYANTDKPMDNLPTIRLFQGYYGSQWAVQWTAYLFLTEALGVNVTWFPNSTHDILSNPSKYGIEWDPEYPHFYFHWIENHDADLLFELFPVAMEEANSSMFFENGSVYDGGTSGIYGEVGWFLPQYLVDSVPTSIVPSVLKNNQTLRDSLISAMTIESDKNWIDEFYILRGDDIANNTYPYDLPNNSTPTIFGSDDTYAMSIYSFSQQKRVLDGTGIDFNYVTLGSEGALSEFMIDLYSKQLPFVANLYSPTVDFATVISPTGELMEFQRVAFERNPSNTVDDVCYQGYYCRQPLVQLHKLGNPNLIETFPEMIDFLDSFTMDANDVLEILLYQQTLYEEAINNSTMDINLTNDEINEIWAEAACLWLKNNTETVEEWDVDITRKDCNEGKGICGFDYYYMNGSTGKNDADKIYITENDDTIGGTCNYDTGICECVETNLTGNCSTSCPGLLGPFYDPDTDDYSFEYCNGNGFCNIKNRLCNCHKGYGSKARKREEEDCSIELKKFKYDPTMTVVFTVIFVLIILLIIASMIWLKMNDEYTMVKAIAPKMTMLFSVGLIFIASGSIIYLFHPITNETCNLRFYLYGIGSVMTITAPLLKAYRIARIYSNANGPGMNITEITDGDLMKTLIITVLFELGVCIIYTIFHELDDVDCEENKEENYIECKCSQSSEVEWIENANYIFSSALLIALGYFSAKTRPDKIFKQFKESNCTYFGSFFTLFTFLVVVVFNLVSQDQEFIITVQSCAVIIVLIVIWVLFYGTRMYKFYMYPERRGTSRVMPANPERATTMRSDGVSMTSPSIDKKSRTLNDGRKGVGKNSTSNTLGTE